MENDSQPQFSNARRLQILNKVLDTKQAAAFLGLTRRCLDIWRKEGRGPVFVKIGARIVRYRLGDLEKFLDENTKQPVAASK